MEERFSCKPYEVSNKFLESHTQIYNYGIDTFGYFQAEKYSQKIDEVLETLPNYYTVYPECRHLVTKSRMYRNIILDSHLIIFRITDQCIEVLDIIHSASSIEKIRSVRSIRL